MNRSTTAAPTTHDRPLLECVSERLQAVYGIPRCEPSGKPLDELVLTILSQHTSDRNAERAFRSLRERFPSWNAVRDARVQEIAEAIRSGGLADTKAPRIQSIVRAALDDHALDDLGQLPLVDAEARLQTLPGVGPKTAACVLLFALGRPALPVDTHVYRVVRRLGLVDERTSPAEVQRELQLRLPPDQVYAFHINLIRHGRTICTARKPCCGACPLNDLCAFARQVGHQRGDKADQAAAGVDAGPT